ncbi:GspE/PulE family protein [Prochlorothrix hollandica]|uniref:General secretion pathway protein GspE n=1 Tax=Prochlorothrix hollandica PCC 9006 = CALU 1027 TaxID=317619 RepID=A0A0M2PU12_PROHO|nr:GspE/PulE family protein [Prochlorothrix hollandica]KKJ00011.1 general secretion pathway protein GspE [Prochlorothrix hollandica PCC 9006 = CALU 1027]
MDTSARSAWQRLRQQIITCDEALKLLVDSKGAVNLTLLDTEVSQRFFREFPEGLRSASGQRQTLPPLLPLLLWQNCYYLGSPQAVEPDLVEQMAYQGLCQIKVLPISEKSYRTWYHTTRLDPNHINADQLINPLTGQTEQEDISEVTEIFLKKAVDQISRLKTIISGALRNRASDIHLEPAAEGLRVRYRIDGVLRDITTLDPALKRRVIVALKVMSEMDISDSRRPQDGRIGEKYKAGDTASVGLDMRVSTLPCIGGEKAVIRLLPQQNPFESLDDLGFTPPALAIYHRWLHQPQGMIIFTGPTGSGKTSTLYTSLQSIATSEVNVITVEDPVEYVLRRINQTQVNEKAGMTFAAGLRSILRQDPDIIMVGEIRDQETAETAVRAALTGHLVLTTLHTNDAISTIPRLKDIGPDPGLISDALIGIVAQRLVRRICPHCGVPSTPTPDELQRLGLSPNHSTEAWRKGTGCEQCFDSGFLGREAVVELLDVDDRVRQLIYQGTVVDLRQYLQRRGYTSFQQAAIAKLNQGLTTPAEVFRVLPFSALNRG